MPQSIRDFFVDRDRQLQAFRNMLGGRIRRRIMLINALQGMGKTWLLQTYAHEAARRRLPHVYIDFGDGQSYDALSLVRRFRDAFGAEHFPTVAEAFVTVLVPQVNITIENSTLNNSPVSVQHVTPSFQTDNPVIRQAIEDRVTTAFFDDLARLTQRATPVFLFDTYGRTSTQQDRWVPGEADRWITGQLLTRLREGRLNNIVVVIAGERTPEFGAEWGEVLGRMSLDPLTCRDVDEYLRQRRGLTSISDADIEVLCQAVNGNPQVLGLIGDNLELAKNPALHDNEW